MTSFSTVYSNFLNKITDDMYMELTPEDTNGMLKDLMLNALHHFEFPRQNIYDYSEETAEFKADLTLEEQNIIGTYMVVEWMGYQLASIENIRMKYSGADFKLTSQANHMTKVLQLKKDYERQGFHLQRLYKRRKADSETGVMKSTFAQIMEVHD